MTVRDLPPFLTTLLASTPAAGEGVHVWLFRVARQLHAHLPSVEIVRLLEDRVQNCGRHVGRTEIVAAVQSSIGCAWQPTGRQGFSTAAPVVRKWPEINQKLRAEIVSGGEGLADLWEASPIRIEENRSHTEEIVDQLFPNNPLLCCGESSSAFDTRSREDWRGSLAGLQLIVPSPMTAITGKTKEGRESRHTLSNTGPRRFLVTEFDTGTTDEQAALLLHLATLAPMALAVFSGSKSLHGWFYCLGQDESRIERFFRYTVSLGADPATWTRSQFVRMPDAPRDNGKRQCVYFFHPQAIKS